MIELNAAIAKKIEIRKALLCKLRSQSSFERSKKSAEIKEKLFNNSAIKSCSCIMFYVSKDYEVDTKDMIIEALRQKKRILVPVTSTKDRKITPSEVKNPKEEFEKGPFGIEQPKSEYLRPVSVNNIDVVIVPGVAFDNKGNRIGHGAGYYDTFLKTLPASTVSIGLAYDSQIVDEVPTLSLDVPVNKVISA